MAPEFLRDLEIDQERQVHVDQDTNDLALTSGIGTVEQSVAIEAGDVLRPIIGETVTDGELDRIESRLTDILNTDPQIEEVVRVNIISVNRESGKVSVDVILRNNNDFQLNIDV